MNLADKIRAEHIDIKKPKPALILRPELLLCPNVPKPMHCVAPRNVLGQKWWDQTRQSAYESTSFHCSACGVWKHDAEYRQWLEAHELYDIDYAKGIMVYVECVSLCHLCHNFIHDGRLQALLEQGKISHQKYAAVMRHGKRILREAGLKKPTYEERENAILVDKIADWASWKLIIDVIIDGKRVHKEVGPRFKSFEEWKQAWECDQL